MNIEISKEDYEFLKDLQHELNTQGTDCQDDPRYWMVMTTEIVPSPNGVGDAYIYLDDGNVCTLGEAVAFVKDNLIYAEKEMTREWNKVHKKDFDEVLDFIKKWFNTGDEVWMETKETISHFSGCFLTKRACVKHIEANRHHYCHPHTYAMTAYRNYELKRLLTILKTMKINQ